MSSGRPGSSSGGGRPAPIPAYLDEVTVLQQPRGSYSLEVFRGFLAVGDEFWFTSRRVEGSSFSLTIFVNKQCHVRLSACCETKRKVGTRLGQGVFQLVRVEQAEPCVRSVSPVIMMTSHLMIMIISVIEDACWTGTRSPRGTWPRSTSTGASTTSGATD